MPAHSALKQWTKTGLRWFAFALLPLLFSACGGGGSEEISGPGASTPAAQLEAPAAAPEAAPLGAIATAGNGEVTVNWTAVQGATSYNIYYLTHPGVTTGNSKQRTEAISGEPVTGLMNTVTYYFRVTAVNAAGESAASSEVSATPMPALPGIPGNVQLTGGLAYATLSWQWVPNATSYNVYYGASPGLPVSSAQNIKGITVTSQKITGLTAAPGHYYFRVTAVNASGESAPSVELTAVAKSAYKAVSAGYGHSAALRIIEPALKVDTGTVWEWGDNSSGQNSAMTWGDTGSGILGLGGASSIQSKTAMMTVGLNSVTSIALGGQHTVVLRTDNSVWNWGLNNKGQLGDNHTTDNSHVPVQPYAPAAMTAVAAGFWHTAALKDDGTIWTWGYNLMGALGYASINCENPGDFNQTLAWSCSYTPTQVTGITGAVTALAAGFDHTLAVTSDGQVWAWGRNDTGQLGNSSPNCPNSIMAPAPQDIGFTGGTTDTTESSCSTIAEQVSSLPGTITAVSAGTRHSVALMSDGTVWTWGGNRYGQLGLASSQTCTITSAFSMSCSVSPAKVPELDHIVAVSSGSDHNLALKNDGTVWTWGYNNSGQLGAGSKTGESPGQTPKQVPGLTGITAVAAGAYHSLALKNDGTVWAWGYNGHGQLGNNSLTDSATPVQVQGLLGPVVIIPGM